MTCITKMIDFKPETFESHVRAVLAGDETEVACALDEIVVPSAPRPVLAGARLLLRFRGARLS